MDISFFSENGTRETLLLDVSDDADLDNISIEYPIDYFDNRNKLGQGHYGGRALVEFPIGNTNKERGIFYIYYVPPPDKSLRVLVKYGDSKSEFTVSREKIGNPQSIMLGPHPACGYATDDKGYVQIYCLASVPMFQTYLIFFSIRADTPDNLSNTLDNDAISYEALNIADQNIVEGVHLTNAIGAGVTYLLKEKHLSAFLPSGGSKVYAFNANTKSMAEYNDMDVPWGASLLFATEATEKDFHNLGCPLNHRLK